MIDNLKTRLLKNRLQAGMFLQIPRIEIVEIMAYSGFDFVIIDWEHGPIGVDVTGALAAAAQAAGIAAVIRVPANDPIYIQKALDLGVDGIMIPQISSEQDAQKAVAAAKYAPEGSRGTCPCVRGLDYGRELGAGIYGRANSETAVILLVEGEEGSKNIDSILATGGVDALLVGPVDLSASLGVPGDINNPKVTAKIKEMVGKAEQLNRCIGVFSMDIPSAQKWVEMGAKFLAHSVDTTFFIQACTNLRNQLPKEEV